MKQCKIWLGIFLLQARLVAIGADQKTEEFANSEELLPPVKILADNKPNDVNIGHSAPFITDFNQDGKMDLLVGQFGEGKLRIYLNQGDNQKPQFGKFKYLKAGGKEASIPSG